ncbi:MAG: DUF2064 domain-containing protein [Chitinophagales bacterium]
MQEKQTTAVLLFTRTVAEEAAVKDFSGLHHQKANAHIANKLINHAAHIVSASGLPFFITDSAHQTGNTFAERFLYAIQEVYDSGFENVIAIGNDCPALTVADILHSKIQLEKNICVIGPAIDGGLYLIGLRKKDFHVDPFLHLPWETKNISEAFENYLHEVSATIFSLILKSDIDGYAAIKQFVHSFLSPAALRLFIQSVLQSITEKISLYKNLPQHTQLQHISSLRAPPVF